MVQRAIEVAFPPKNPIHCIYSANDQDDLRSSTPALIFTHGAGGTLKSDAIANFVNGFVSAPDKTSILCFQGNMNLNSRLKMFNAVIDASQSHPDLGIETTARCLGGRSMGARAAVMAVTEETTHLVLASYPLHTDKEVRDKILLDLPETIKVIFVSGDHDSMCDLQRLEDVRNSMKCRTWRVVVQGADHGMNVKPKAATKDVGEATGIVVANWLASSDESLTEGQIVWDAEKDIAQWNGWSSKPHGLQSRKAVVIEDSREQVPKTTPTPHQAKNLNEKLSSRKRSKPVEKKTGGNDARPAPKKRRKA